MHWSLSPITVGRDMNSTEYFVVCLVSVLFQSVFYNFFDGSRLNPTISKITSAI